MNKVLLPLILVLISLSSACKPRASAPSAQPQAGTVTPASPAEEKSKPAGATPSSAAAGNKQAWSSPDFTLAKVTGDDSLTLSSFKGSVIILNFWATWCPPCRMEIPDLVELYGKYKDKGLAIIGVSLDSGGSAGVKRFVIEKGITYPVVIGNEKISNSFGGISGIPTTFIIDRTGNIKERIVGLRQKTYFEDAIKKLL
jgi:thiol-disulfide isomerase/thioredoxin